jgi:release factor glutamine methyltransferase
MITSRQLLSQISQQFHSFGLINYKSQAGDLICDFLDLQKKELFQNLDRPLSETESQKCLEWAERRLKEEPLAYISGKVYFYDCLLKITPSVLVPRQETEILTDKIANQLSLENLSGKVLWDLCCGSGCIGIALKKKFPELTVCSSDFSSEALNLAKENSQLNHVNIDFRLGDLFEPFAFEEADYIVCNPPYISEAEYEQLDSAVRLFEPRMALVGGVSGLEFYERLAAELPAFTKSNFKAWMEIGYNQKQSVQKLFDRFNWKTAIENDWAGHPRFFFLENE